MRKRSNPLVIFKISLCFIFLIACRSSDRSTDRSIDRAIERCIKRPNDRAIEQSSDLAIDRPNDRAIYPHRATERLSDRYELEHSNLLFRPLHAQSCTNKHIIQRAGGMRGAIRMTIMASPAPMKTISKTSFFLF